MDPWSGADPDGPIPYKLSSRDPDAAADRMARAHARRLVYASALMVAFALGTWAGLMLNSCP